MASTVVLVGFWHGGFPSAVDDAAHASAVPRSRTARSGRAAAAAVDLEVPAAPVPVGRTRARSARRRPRARGGPPVGMAVDQAAARRAAHRLPHRLVVDVHDLGGLSCTNLLLFSRICTCVRRRSASGFARNSAWKAGSRALRPQAWYSTSSVHRVSPSQEGFFHLPLLNPGPGGVRHRSPRKSLPIGNAVAVIIRPCTPRRVKSLRSAGDHGS